MRYIPFNFMGSGSALGNARVKYRYTATGGGRVKQMRDYTFLYNDTILEGAFIFGGCSIVLPVLCFSTSADSYTETDLNNSLINQSNKIEVSRTIKMDDPPTGMTNSCEVEIYINNVLVDSQVNLTSQIIPVVGTSTGLTQNFIFNDITVNYGDFLEIKWIDDIAS